MDETGLQTLHDQETLRRRVADGDLPGWARDHYGAFRETTLGERDGAPFPCYFGVQSERDGDALYTFVPSSTDPRALLGLRDALAAYCDVFRDYADRCSLVTFFAPDPRLETEADYHERLWHVLQFLHVHDPEPWPADVPTDPEDPYFEFCFAGEPIFPTTRAPFYDPDERASRFCPVGLEVTFQPRAIFEGITGDTVAGERARETIRDRLDDYDGACPHADLGDYGEDREWVQYMLADGPGFPETCPLEVTREHPKADPALDPRPAPVDVARERLVADGGRGQRGADPDPDPDPDSGSDPGSGSDPDPDPDAGNGRERERER